MIRILTTGTLYGAPATKTGSSGKPFTTGKLRGDAGNGETVWCSLIAFGNVSDDLAALSDGDAVAVAGRATLKVYEGRNGAQVTVDVVIDQVTTLKAKPKASEPKPAPKARQKRVSARSNGDPFADLDGCGDLAGVA
jgi:single-stranded DNA-binding protein